MATTTEWFRAPSAGFHVPVLIRGRCPGADADRVLRERGWRGHFRLPPG